MLFWENKIFIASETQNSFAFLQPGKHFPSPMLFFSCSRVIRYLHGDSKVFNKCYFHLLLWQVSCSLRFLSGPLGVDGMILLINWLLDVRWKQRPATILEARVHVFLGFSFSFTGQCGVCWIDQSPGPNLTTFRWHNDCQSYQHPWERHFPFVFLCLNSQIRRWSPPP